MDHPRATIEISRCASRPRKIYAVLASRYAMAIDAMTQTKKYAKELNALVRSSYADQHAMIRNMHGAMLS